MVYKHTINPGCLIVNITAMGRVNGSGRMGLQEISNIVDNLTCSVVPYVTGLIAYSPVVHSYHSGMSRPCFTELVVAYSTPSHQLNEIWRIMIIVK